MFYMKVGVPRGRPPLSITFCGTDVPPAPISRNAWIDVAKGGSIMLVVLMHVSVWFATNVDGDGARFWVLFSDVFGPIRMPLFFFVSGFLAVGALTKPLSASFSKTVGLYVLYVFWTGVFLARTWHPALRNGMAAPDLQHYLASLLLPTVFWYIWALPLFYLIAWVAHRALGHASSLLLLPAAALALAYAPIIHATQGMFPPPLAPAMIDSVTSNLVWFLVGLHFHRRWLDAIAHADMRYALLGCAAYAFIIGLSMRLGIDAKAMKLVAAPVALFTCAQMFGLFRLTGVIAAFFAHVGRMTLPVYIFHLFGIAVMSALFKISGLDMRFQAAPPLLGAIFIPILSIALVSSCRSVGEILANSPFKWLVVPMRLPGKTDRQNPAAPAKRYLPVRHRSEQ